MPTGATREWRWLIPAEAPGRLDRFEFVEVELVDGLQGLGGGAVVKAVGQGLEPGPVFGLQSDEFGDGIAPALGPAAAVGGSPLRKISTVCGVSRTSTSLRAKRCGTL